MSRKVILETSYTFTPATNTVVIPRYIPIERLISIVNITTGYTIYDFQDNSFKAKTYTAALSNSPLVSDTTTIVLLFNTSLMSATDKLQFFVDEYTEKFTPSETQLDPTNKMRVSTPQALIDTDFEYGTQISKWENLATTNLRPYAYTTNVTVPGITDIAMTAGSRTVTVTGTNMPVLTIGQPVVIGDTLNPIANGTFAVDSSVTPTSGTFAYVARAAAAATGSIFDSNKTVVSQGTYYTGAAIGGAPTWSYGANKISATTTIPHGLSVGNEIQVAGTTATTGAPNGTWIVAQVPSPTQVYFYLTSPDGTPVTPTGTITGGLIYSRPQGSVLHRPFDGGVIFSSNGTSNYEGTTRQTRRYFRYQSGKGLQISSGTILKPNFQIDSLKFTTANNTVTVQTKDQHNLQPGSTIVVSGANQALFNGTFTIYSITGYNTFTYTPTVANGGVDVTASGIYYASITGWYGAVNRLGMFDQQNGLFFEYDGQTLYAVRRNSTYQISGRIDVNAGSTTVTATTNFTTSFTQQLTIGDFIVLRGASYRVDDITSDTSLTISPAFRGASNVTGVVVSKTQDVKIPQSSWNLDRMDGTGPSGYNIDLARMQMFYIDFTWYGAGFVRWGLRGANGDVTYVHKMPNNNLNFEAYMRSGNLPARYESITQPPRTVLGASVATGDTSITVADTTGFPPSGTLAIKGTAYEHVNYTAKTGTTFTGLTRAQAGATSAALSLTTPITTSGGNGGVIPVTTTTDIAVSSISGIAVGQTVSKNTGNGAFPTGTKVTSINTSNVTLTNLITNPNFETNSAGWQGAGGTSASVAQSSDHSYIGTKSLLVTYVTAGSAGNNGANFPTSSLLANTTYTFSAWVYTPTGGNKPFLSIQSSAVGFTNVQSVAATSFDTWERLSLRFTTTAATPGYNLYVLNGSAVTGGQTTYVDAAMLEQSSVLNDYFEGTISTATNLISNPSFDVNTNDWVVGSAGSPTISRVTTQNYVGSTSASLQFVNPTGVQYASILNKPSGTRLAVTAGYKYTFSFYIKNSTSTSQWFGSLKGYNAASGGSQTPILDGSAVTISTGYWTRLSVTATIPAGVTHLECLITNASTDATNATVFVDGVLLEQSSVLRDYFDTTTNLTLNTIRVSAASTTDFANGTVLKFLPSVGSNIISNGTPFSGAQVGQRIVSNTAGAFYPDGTFISQISPDFRTLTLTQALTGNTPVTNVTTVPMSFSSAQSYTYSATDPIAVELAFPTFAPTISHWGTSVIMDGRFDDDKSLLFTYGQTSATTVAAGATAPLLSIRVSPSVDNGKAAPFGSRDLVNRMQLVLRALDISMTQATATQLLVTAVLNGTTSATQFTSAGLSSTAAANTDITIASTPGLQVGMLVTASGGTITSFPAGTVITKVTSATSIQLSNAINVSGTTLNYASTWASLTAPTSSLAQVADFASSTTTTISGGEVTGGFFVASTGSIELDKVRDLGNSILGGGGATPNSAVYPDGPDVLTIVVKNVGAAQATVLGRLAWTEAQA